MAALHVRVHQVAHLRVDPLLYLLGEQSLADLLQIAERTAPQRLGCPADQILELHAAELVLETGGDHADQLTDAHVAAAHPLAGEDHRGKAGDQRAVEIEERPDLRSRRAGHDFGHRTGQSDVTRSPVAHE